MKNLLHFDFQVDPSRTKIKIQREFAADHDMVWAAWTEHELLDLWWAPRPYQTKTISMDFRTGGSWFYYMYNPEGHKHYCRADYDEVIPKQSFNGLDAFCDEEGNILMSMPRANWLTSFSDKETHTLVQIDISYNSVEDLEKVVEMGFKDGLSMAMENLDQYLSAQGKLRMALKSNTSPRVSTYLNFPGNTEEAFLFYKEVFKSDFNGGIQRFEDVPAEAGNPPVAESLKRMILHVELPILGTHTLMGTDAPKEMGFTLTAGNNMHISLEPENRAETKRIFEALAEGGNITMPLADMFWGAYYGSLTDRFGINWMLNCTSKD
ncbi:MAG: hypothetical protein EP332_02150 [Bacteroidetes bacterium]|nr:MAG: hypothetical protein EP332_02150 [Bacteroidota bacterium]